MTCPGLHFHGLPDTSAAAAVIRQAISGPVLEPVGGRAPAAGPALTGPDPIFTDLDPIVTDPDAALAEPDPALPA